MNASNPSAAPAKNPDGDGAGCTPESCPHCGHQCGRAPVGMAELRMAALGEVLKAGIDASKDISWQIRCGKTQDLAFARVSRAVRLTVLLSAKLEADPALEGFRAKRRAEAVHAPVGGTGEALAAPAPAPVPARRSAATEADGEAWDRESVDDEDGELDEVERDLADERPVGEILGEACKLMGRTVDLSAFDEDAPDEPAPAPAPAAAAFSEEERQRFWAALAAYRSQRGALRAAGRDPPDG